MMETMDQDPSSIIEESSQHNALEGCDMPDSEVPTEKRSGNGRLIVKKIVLKNFKSYAGVVTIGPLHKVRKGEIWINYRSYTSLCNTIVV